MFVICHPPSFDRPAMLMHLRSPPSPSPSASPLSSHVDCLASRHRPHPATQIFTPSHPVASAVKTAVAPPERASQSVISLDPAPNGSSSPPLRPRLPSRRRRCTLSGPRRWFFFAQSPAGNSARPFAQNPLAAPSDMLAPLIDREGTNRLPQMAAFGRSWSCELPQ